MNPELVLHICWMCDERKLRTVLIEIGINEFQCPLCHANDTRQDSFASIYYNCTIHPHTLNWGEKDAGKFCTMCQRHYCLSCWGTSGKFIKVDGAESDWVCETCGGK